MDFGGHCLKQMRIWQENVNILNSDGGGNNMEMFLQTMIDNQERHMKIRREK